MMIKSQVSVSKQQAPVDQTKLLADRASGAAEEFPEYPRELTLLPQYAADVGAKRFAPRPHERGDVAKQEGLI